MEIKTKLLMTFKSSDDKKDDAKADAADKKRI